MAAEEEMARLVGLAPAIAPPPIPVPRITVAPADIDVSPQISVHMPRSPWFTYYALYRAGMAVQDLIKPIIQGSLIDKLSDQLPGIANWPMSLCFDAKRISYSELSSKVLEQIGVQYKFLMSAWKAGIGAGMGAAYGAEIEQFMNPGQLLYAYSTLQYQASVVPRMRRHWMSMYTPTVPNSQMAFNLLMRGAIRDSQFEEYASYDGWDKKGIQFLRDVWKSIPNERAAFRLFMRGHIEHKDFVKYVKMNAWPDEWVNLIYALYEWLPNARESFRLWKRNIIDKTQRNKWYGAHGYTGWLHETLTKLYELWPNSSMAFRMLARGKITRKDYNRFIEGEGWLPGAADLLYGAYERLPSSMEAFYLHRKGIISLDERNRLYQAYGFDKRWHSRITENFQYVPTFYDLCRLSDFVEVDPIWATDVMRRRGMADRDIIKCLPMLRIRPLRNEIVRHVTIWVNRYKLGWISATTFEAAMQAMLEAGWIQSREKELITAEAELKYEDELMREEIDCLTWCYKTEKITQDDLEESLLDLGIREEKMNLMVRLLKCQSYYGYH